jgi:hypothetical protein
MAEQGSKTGIDAAVSSDKGYQSPSQAGDFRLLEVAIISPSNPKNKVELNSGNMFVQLELFEDLFSNVLKGTYTFQDTQGYPELIPIIGDETLILTFMTPGGEGSKKKVSTKLEPTSKSEEVYKQRFKVYDIIRTETGENHNIYKLFFVSEEYVLSTKMKVSKGYKGKRYSEIVKDLMKKVNVQYGWHPGVGAEFEKKIFIEETATPQNVIIPNWTPLEAINFCAARSISGDVLPADGETASATTPPKPVGSLFVFFEKLGTGFFYQSIESMIISQRKRKNIPMYQYIPKLAGDRSQNITTGYFGVDQFEIKSSFKTLENLGYGMYGSKLIAFDPIRMKYDEVKYDYYDKSDDPTTDTLDEKTGATQTQENPEEAKDDTQRVFSNFIATDVGDDGRTNKTISRNSSYIGSNNAAVRLATTTKDHDVLFIAPPESAPPITYAGKISKKKTFKDQGAKSNRVENWLLQRHAQIHEFENVIVSFTIAGNSSRHVGDLIKFELPTTIPTDHPTALSTSLTHQLYAGYYLVSKIRHYIVKDDYKMDMELIKNSFAKRIPGQKSAKEEAQNTE